MNVLPTRPSRFLAIWNGNLLFIWLIKLVKLPKSGGPRSGKICLFGELSTLRVCCIGSLDNTSPCISWWWEANGNDNSSERNWAGVCFGGFPLDKGGYTYEYPIMWHEQQVGTWKYYFDYHITFLAIQFVFDINYMNWIIPCRYPCEGHDFYPMKEVDGNCRSVSIVNDNDD